MGSAGDDLLGTSHAWAHCHCALNHAFNASHPHRRRGCRDWGLPGWLFALIQIILQTIGYAILFKLVPNCRVPFTHALTGGAAVALAGQVFREAFEYYITAGTLSSIYGAFVAFPVFLLWFYIAWMLVFAGAAITATLPQLTSGRFADSYKLGNDFLTGLALLRELTSARASGSPLCV